MTLALICAALVGSPAEAVTPAPDAERIGILELTVIGLDKTIGATAIDTLAEAIARTGRHEVITRNELVAMLNAEANKQLLGCTDTDCLAAIGAAAGVELALSGSIARLDELLVVGLQLVDVSSAAVRGRVALEYAAPLGGLPRLLELAALRLIYPAEELTPGTTRFTGLPAEATLTIDGVARGQGPTTLDGLEVGIHRLTVTAPGFELYSAPFIVLGGDAAEQTVRLTPVAPPFWTRWWFWTVVGSAVVGTTTALLLSAGEEPSGARLRTAAPGVLP